MLEKTCLNYGQHTHSSVLVSCYFFVVSMTAPEWSLVWRGWCLLEVSGFVLRPDRFCWWNPHSKTGRLSGSSIPSPWPSTISSADTIICIITSHCIPKANITAEATVLSQHTTTRESPNITHFRWCNDVLVSIDWITDVTQLCTVRTVSGSL